MSIEEALLEKVRALPPAKNKGILADLNFTLSEEDLAAARREMWGEFPQ